MALQPYLREILGGLFWEPQLLGIGVDVVHGACTVDFDCVYLIMLHFICNCALLDISVYSGLMGIDRHCEISKVLVIGYTREMASVKALASFGDSMIFS
jgi:hypothetical protein